MAHLMRHLKIQMIKVEGVDIKSAKFLLDDKVLVFDLLICELSDF